MINFMFKGHKISIRNDDWRNLKERFNPDKAEEHDDSTYFIDVSCSLCERHYTSDSTCRTCPIDKLSESRARFGCTILINSILRKKTFRLGFNDIYWDKKNNAQARRQLRIILRRMEKIEASQKGGRDE